MSSIHDKIQGSLVGGAVGDALGYPIEFYSIKGILSSNDGKIISDYRISLHNTVAEISDDTQMTLFTCDGIIEALDKNRSLVESIYRAYLRWYITQTSEYDPNRYGLLSIEELFNQRAPGNTCMSALGSGKYGTFGRPINNSKGCGGVMRVAPIGYLPRNKYDIPLEAAKAAAITHGNPLGYIPAAIFASIINEIIYNDQSILESVFYGIKQSRRHFDGQDFNYQVSLIEKALSLAYNSNSDIDNISKIGEGWVAEETLAIALYCIIKHRENFEAAIVASVNHSGDSDSTGAVTGNIIGAMLGIDKIPSKYKNNLELYDIILEIGNKIYEFIK